MRREHSIPAAFLAVALLGGCSSKDTASPATAAGAVTPEPARPLPSPLPPIAARVNGEAVPSMTVAIYARELIARGTYGREQRAEAMRAAVEHLIEREALLQEALNRGIGADEADLNVAYDAARAKHKTDAEWTAFLAEQGTDPAVFRRELRVQKTVDALLRQSQDSAALARDLRARARVERFY